MSIFLVTKKGVTQLPLHFWDTLSHLSYLMLPPANVENGQPRTSVKQANNPKYYQLIENTKMLKDIPCFVFFLLHRLFSKAPEVDLPREWILMSPCPITTASLFSNLILPVLTWKHCTCYKLFKKTNKHAHKQKKQLVTGITPTLHKFWPKAVTKAFRWLWQQRAKAFRICSLSKDSTPFAWAPLCHQRRWCSLAGFC